MGAASADQEGILTISQASHKPTLKYNRRFTSEVLRLYKTQRYLLSTKVQAWRVAKPVELRHLHQWTRKNTSKVQEWSLLFPTCQVRVVRFYVSCRSSSSSPPSPPCLLPDLNHDHPRPVFAAGPQPRPATPSVCCRTSTTTSHAQCSLLAAGPQPRPSTPMVRCRTSTTTINAQCSLPDLNSNAKSYAR